MCLHHEAFSRFNKDHKIYMIAAIIPRSYVLSSLGADLQEIQQKIKIEDDIHETCYVFYKYEEEDEVDELTCKPHIDADEQCNYDDLIHQSLDNHYFERKLKSTSSDFDKMRLHHEAFPPFNKDHTVYMVAAIIPRSYVLSSLEADLQEIQQKSK
ncbi:unnamed protein product [Rotaria sordida]|uniref:Uncharacterized protein n=1 Tax=Rotaria sordida TaxID=392033 RepID=A0A814YLU0_9BILA|nr:unnamed protein product [Rotaria sordida]